MSDDDVLLTVAEVAIALAGFSSVVAAFGRGAGHAWSAVDRFRLAQMLEHSLAAALFAFVPFCVSHLATDPAAIWATSSGLFAIFLVAETGLVVPRMRALGSERESLRPWLSAIMALCAVAALLLQMANVFGFGFERQAGPYVIGLVLMLVASGAQFSRLLFLGISPGRDG